jgi:hypothetical protein
MSALLSACGGGAVVFAPTPLPPDASLERYTHPSASFSLAAPRLWSLHEQYTVNLASASFAPPGTDAALITTGVINLGQEIDTETFAALIDRYQAQIRPDIQTYTEHNREPLGDGSWRVTGIRVGPAGAVEQVNTFIERDGPLLGVTDVTVPADARSAATVEQIVNSIALVPNAATLEPTDLTTLTYVRPGALSVLHVASWSSADGVFFVTGEVANTGAQTVTNVPVEVTLVSADGLNVGGAVDTVMGYGLTPGAFAPFSLRFGQGQPAIAADVVVRVGGTDWQSDPDAVIFGADALDWQDASRFDDQGRLSIEGSVRNSSASSVYNVRAIATIFDEAERVIGTAWADVTPQLRAGETAPYALVVPELGGEPVNYIVVLQATD